MKVYVRPWPYIWTYMHWYAFTSKANQWPLCRQAWWVTLYSPCHFWSMWPVAIIVFAHVVCSYVRPHFSKQNKFKAKTMFATGKTVGLAEWIIDDTCLVVVVFNKLDNFNTIFFVSLTSLLRCIEQTGKKQERGETRHNYFFQFVINDPLGHTYCPRSCFHLKVVLLCFLVRFWKEGRAGGRQVWE